MPFYVFVHSLERHVHIRHRSKYDQGKAVIVM